ncbi:hypothetical protein MMC28_010842 [Mycoblastus sanguinarius]|nr:hypothetical protein [Mycoblastus sanguinarius]
MVIEDQSAHDATCFKACKKLKWDESSYRAVSGARAVALCGPRDENKGYISYCQAAEKTLAISHVWSHGQGGRPHVGVNCCLHWRYVDIARRLGCDSYWWDSACIPEDHDLRAEAISNINEIFARSKVTLVCDRDLMDIEVSNLTLELKESILATVLVCDWNIRAWTFLESLRGRHQIHLLCKNNQAVPFREILKDIFNHGSIDLAILGLTLQHMLPQPLQLRLPKYSAFYFAGPKIDNGSMDLVFMSRENAGEILSYRPASRQGDDVVIWSLLVGNGKCESAEELFRRDIEENIHIGFLMSSAPRLKKKGLTWAPCTPYFKPSCQISRTNNPSFRAFSGGETYPGLITDKGLVADWLVHEFNAIQLSVAKSSRKQGEQDDDRIIENSQLQELKKIQRRFLRGYVWGALIHPVSNMRTFERGGDISTKYRGFIRGTLVAVLGSSSLERPSQKKADDRGWVWKGTFEWDEHISLADFTEDPNFLIT